MGFFDRLRSRSSERAEIPARTRRAVPPPPDLPSIEEQVAT